MSTPPRQSRRAFTLIELLTVIAILGVLASIIIPVVGKVRESARNSTCASNLRQIAAAFHLYAADNRGLIPAALGESENPTGGFWMAELNPYVGKDAPESSVANAEISDFFTCPAYFAENPTVPVWRRGYGMTTRPTRPLRAGTAPGTAQASRTLLSSWPEPARNIIVGESERQMILTTNTGVFNDPLNGTPDRHAGRSNYAFLDGSVQSLDARQAGDFLRWTQP